MYNLQTKRMIFLGSYNLFNLRMIRGPSKCLYLALTENFSLKADTSRSSGCRTNTNL